MTLAECIEAEMERLKAGEDRVSAMPLHYAIRALLGLGVAAGHPGLQTLLNEVEQYLEATGRDKGGQIKRNLKKFREANAGQMPPGA